MIAVFTEIQRKTPEIQAVITSGQTDVVLQAAIALLSLRKEEIRWEAAMLSAMIAETQWLIGISDEAPHVDVSRSRYLLECVILAMKKREREVNGCPETTSANLDRQSSLLESAFSEIQNDLVLLDGREGHDGHRIAFERLLRHHLGIAKMLELKSEQWKSADYGFPFSDEESKRRSGVLQRLRGTDSHRLDMLNRLSLHERLKGKKCALLEKLISESKDEVKRRLTLLYADIDSYSGWSILFPFELRCAVDPVKEGFEELWRTHHEYDDVRQLDLGFETYIRFRKELARLKTHNADRLSDRD